MRDVGIVIQFLSNRTSFIKFRILSIEKLIPKSNIISWWWGLFNVKQSMGGRQDASYGVYMEKNQNRQFRVHDLQLSGFFVGGEIRQIGQLKSENGRLIIVARNENGVKIFRLNRGESDEFKAR